MILTTFISHSFTNQFVFFMKKITLLLLAIPFIFSSCSKKEYATFQTTHTAPLYQSTELANTIENNTIEEANEAPLTALAEAEPEIILEVNNAEIVEAKKETKVASSPNKASSLSTKIHTLKEINAARKELKSIQKLEKTKQGGSVDTLALLSLIFGGVALLSIGFFGLGVLLGIAALIMGIIALKRNSPQKVLAIIGVSLGSIAIFIGLIFFLFLAALFNSNNWQ